MTNVQHTIEVWEVGMSAAISIVIPLLSGIVLICCDVPTKDIHYLVPWVGV